MPAVSDATGRGTEMIAEGIETREQLEYLKEIGCDCGQGFFFSRPLDEKGLDAFIEGETIRKNPAGSLHAAGMTGTRRWESYLPPV